VTEVANIGAGREREKKLRISVQFATARGKTRHHCSSRSRRTSLQFLEFLGAVFVIFKLFNVIFCV
jgi:hypothetical protein